MKKPDEKKKEKSNTFICLRTFRFTLVYVYEQRSPWKATLILIDRLSKHGVVHHHLAPNPRVHAGDSPKQKQTFTTKM